jgi:hypothetical protein
MFCPRCQTEYGDTSTRCPACHVALVASVDAAKPAEEDRPALVWSGGDPVTFSVVLAALQNAEIPHYQLADHDQLRWYAAMPKPRYGIFVPQHDAGRAEKVIREAFAAHTPETDAPE